MLKRIFIILIIAIIFSSPIIIGVSPRIICYQEETKCSTDKQYLLICNDLGTGYDEYSCAKNCVYDNKEGAICSEWLIGKNNSIAPYIIGIAIIIGFIILATLIKKKSKKK